MRHKPHKVVNGPRRWRWQPLRQCANRTQLLCQQCKGLPGSRPAAARSPIPAASPGLALQSSGAGGQRAGLGSTGPCRGPPADNRGSRLPPAPAGRLCPPPSPRGPGLSPGSAATLRQPISSARSPWLGSPAAFCRRPLTRSPPAARRVSARSLRAGPRRGNCPSHRAAPPRSYSVGEAAGGGSSSGGSGKGGWPLGRRGGSRGSHCPGQRCRIAAVTSGSVLPLRGRASAVYRPQHTPQLPGR